MSKRRRADLRTLGGLLPFLRPYAWWAVALVLISFAFAAADVGRAQLVKPLLNDVFLQSSEVRGQVEDERLVRGLSAERGGEVARIAAALPPPTRDELLAVGRDPFLKGAGRFDASAEGMSAAAASALGQSVAKLLERTSELLLQIADGLPPPDEADALPLWEDVVRASSLQREAIARAASGQAADLELAAGLSIQARELARDTRFQDAFSRLKEICGYALLLALVLAVCQFSVLYLSRTLVARVFVDLQNRTAEHLLPLSVRFFEGERRGDLLSRLTMDLQFTSNLITTLTDLVIFGLHLIVLSSWAVWVSWQLSLSLVFLALFVFLPIRWWGKRIRRAARRRQGAVGNVLEAMQQMFAGIREVKGFQRERHEEERFVGIATDGFKHHVGTIRARVASKSWQQFLKDLSIPLLFLLGGYCVVTRRWDLDVGDFGVFLGLVLLMHMPAKAVGESYNVFMDALPSLERVLHLLHLRPELTEAPDAQPIERIEQGIRVEGVSFSYDGTTPVLEDVSFEVPAGSMTAIVGQTGSGKTTLVDLIARFYDPSAGRIEVDGRDLRALRLDAYFDLLAVVSQDNFLFNGTIRENIRYGRLDASDAEVEEAARQAFVHEEILACAEGYETVVGERGGRLSGGQRQRVAIARAILKGAQLLILDEATSALDTRTERLVQQALGALASQATSFVIAHRLSTVQQADQILVLDKGRLVERGTHGELLAMGGIYAALVERQLEGQLDDAAEPAPGAPGDGAAGGPGPPPPGGLGGGDGSGGNAGRPADVVSVAGEPKARSEGPGEVLSKAASYPARASDEPEQEPR